MTIWNAIGDVGGFLLSLTGFFLGLVPVGAAALAAQIPLIGPIAAIEGAAQKLVPVMEDLKVAFEAVANIAAIDVTSMTSSLTTSAGQIGTMSSALADIAKQTK
jgi:hypothetical protein